MSASCRCTAPATIGNLCTRHATQLKDLVLNAPALIDELDVTVTRQDAQGGQGTGSESPMVFNPRAAEARDELARLLHTMAAAAIRRTSVIVVMPDHEKPTTKAALTILRLFNGLAGDDSVHAWHEALVESTLDAVRAIDRAEERVTYGPCECGTELSAPRSKDVATCKECGNVYPVADLRAYRHVQALDALAEHTGPVAELAKLLAAAGHPIPLNTLKAWVRAGKLKPVSRSAAGVALYRAGDALDLRRAD